MKGKENTRWNWTFLANGAIREVPTLAHLMWRQLRSIPESSQIKRREHIDNHDLVRRIASP